MAAAGEKPKAAARRLRILRFRQDAAAAGHHRIGGEDEASGMAGLDGQRLGHRQAPGMLGRKFALQVGFIDLRGIDRVGFDPDLPQQLQPSGRGRGEDQPRPLGCRHC